MNYIEEMNAFNVWITLHPEVSSSAQLLWYVLMHYNNTCSWKKQFSVPMSMLMTSTRLSESSVKRARLALQKAGRIRYCVRPGKKATVYEMISMKEEGIVTSFLSGNSAAIAMDMSDSEEINSGENNSEEIVSADADTVDEGKDTEGNRTSQNKDQSILQNEGQSIPKNGDKKDCLGELLPERLPERPAERLPERLPERILKLNETKLDISKESTKKGSEAILEQLQENIFENAEGDMSNVTLQSKSVSTIELQSNATITSKETSKSTAKSTAKSNKADEEEPFVPPTLEMVQAYCREKGYHIDPEALMAYHINPEAFMAYYDAVGWSVGKKMMKSWKPRGRRWFITRDEAG